MRTSTKILLTVLACALALIYLGPVVYILEAPARRLPQTVRPRPVSLAVEPLDESSSAVLLWTSLGISNEPFPEEMTGSPVRCPETPPARIRTTISVHRDSSFLQLVYFPVLVLRGLVLVCGPLILILYIGNLVVEILDGRRKIKGAVVQLLLVVTVSGAVIYCAGVGPSALWKHSGQQRKLIWTGSPLVNYLQGVALFASPKTYRDENRGDVRLTVVNGMGFPVDLYADGAWFDRIPPYDIRDYDQLTFFSRITGVNAATHSIINDFHAPKAGDKGSYLIYNVGGADTLSVAQPPAYDCF